jgi:hypothetical protein
MRVILCLALVACGSHGGTNGDGGDGDGPGSGAIDGAPIDVPNVRGTVKIHVENTGSAGGNCMPGIHVVYIDTDATVTPVTADATGAAQADVFPGASVTAICHRMTGSYTLATILAVEPGDELTLNAGAFISGKQTIDATSLGSFTVTYPAYSGAAKYTVYTPCGSIVFGGTSGSFSMAAGCALSPMDVVVAANSGTGAVLAFAEQTGVTFTPGGTVNVTGPYKPMATISAQYTNPSAKVKSIELDRMAPDLRGLRSTATQDTNGGTVTLMTPSLTTTHATMQTILSPCAMSDPNCSETGSQVITKVVDGTQTSYAVDVGATMLPWLAPPVYDPATQTIKITQAGSGAYDLFETDLQYVRMNSIIYIWRVFGPTAGDVKLPALPGGESPTASDIMSATHTWIGESDSLSGYRAARQNVFDARDVCEQSQSPTAKRLAATSSRFMRSN